MLPSRVLRRMLPRRICSRKRLVKGSEVRDQLLHYVTESHGLLESFDRFGYWLRWSQSLFHLEALEFWSLAFNGLGCFRVVQESQWGINVSEFGMFVISICF